ncbi:hypothetical protein TRVA0_061S00672 [Trichomonascus vanleenenianus]|uniref:uncharacterized protein n=1 Tax=Trichomonascus vanleenenianus TaxID=2268995 RepID=UPI003ECA3C51
MMNSSTLTALSNSTLTDITTSIIDDAIPAGSLHDAILALLIGSPPFVFAALALAVASCNPAESQRRGLWVLLAGFPWGVIKDIKNSQFGWRNALTQRCWQLFAAADNLSRYYNDADYELPLEVKTLGRTAFALSHTLPVDWEYDVYSTRDHPDHPNAVILRCMSVRRGRVNHEGDVMFLDVDARLRTSSLTDSGPSITTKLRHGFQSDVLPISSYRLVLFWRNSIFKACVIIGLWMAAMTCGMGKSSVWGLFGLAVCILLGWIVQVTMVSSYESQPCGMQSEGEESDIVLSALAEAGKKNQPRPAVSQSRRWNA